MYIQLNHFSLFTVKGYETKYLTNIYYVFSADNDKFVPKHVPTTVKVYFF